jgi:signal transduction histidine kinase
VRRSSLSWKILLGVVPVLLVALAVSVVLQNRFQELEMMDQAQASAHTYAAIIRESMVSMMVNAQEVDSTFILRVASIEQFDSMRVLVNNLRLREELLPEDQRERILAKPRNSQRNDSLQAAVLRNGNAVYLRTGESFRALIPFNATKVCQRCHAVPLDYTLGAADLHLSLERYAEASAWNWRRSAIIFLLFTIVVVAVATWIFKRYVARPVDRLVLAASEMKKGNLAVSVAGTRRGLPDAVRDELDVLAERFDETRLSLADKIARLDEMNAALTTKNADVEEALIKLRKTQEDLVRSERLAVTGKMAAQLSHEINNPIHNAQSLLESSLRRLHANHEARELVAMALDEVSRMARLTRQLLDVYRGSTADPSVGQVQLGELLTDLVKLHRDSFAKQGITTSIEIDGQLSPVLGSRDKLQQVFLNLFLNARDAMPSGGTLTIRAANADPTTRVEVSDTGTGIAPEHADLIFEPFFTTKKAVSGVGLGLSVSYGIIQQHNGTITFYNRAGGGTTFVVCLPNSLPQVNHGT